MNQTVPHSLLSSLSPRKQPFTTWESRKTKLRELMPLAKAHTAQWDWNPCPAGSQACVSASPPMHPFHRPRVGKDLVHITQQKAKKEAMMLLSLYIWGN